MESKRLNNRGFGGYELLTMAMVCLVLATIVLRITLKAQDKERYKVFVYDAKTIGINAVQLQMLEEQKVIYLSELIDKGYVPQMKNPFNGKEFCNLNESKVVFDGDEKRVYLRCGDFLIKNQPLGASKVDIYKVSSWNEKKESNKVSQLFYNYLDNKKEVFDEYLEEDLFLKKMNLLKKSKYKTIEDLKNAVKVEEKTLYRLEKVIMKMDY